MIKSMQRAFVVFAVSAFAIAAGCSSSPSTSQEKTEANDEATAALAKFQAADPSLDAVLSSAAGYTVFPKVGKGGLIVGGAHGRGTVYQGGQVIGYAGISQASIGLQAGGEQFAELIVFKTPEALAQFKNNEMTFTADASANAADKGAAAAAKFEKGVATFIKPEKGLMAGAVIGGQKFTFTPSAEAAK
jgi:lipid-binding SYLF domain-containing protein